MLAAITAAREEVKNKGTCMSGKVYNRAVALHSEEVSHAQLLPSNPPVDMHPNPTSGGVMEKLLDKALVKSRCTINQQRSSIDSDAQEHNVDEITT